MTQHQREETIRFLWFLTELGALNYVTYLYARAIAYGFKR